MSNKIFINDKEKGKTEVWIPTYLYTKIKRITNLSEGKVALDYSMKVRILTEGLAETGY